MLWFICIALSLIQTQRQTISTIQLWQLVHKNLFWKKIVTEQHNVICLRVSAINNKASCKVRTFVDCLFQIFWSNHTISTHGGKKLFFLSIILVIAQLLFNEKKFSHNCCWNYVIFKKFRRLVIIALIHYVSVTPNWYKWWKDSVDSK